jgi:hypothetical protein
MRKRTGQEFPWAALVALVAGGTAAMGALANYAEGALRPFFVLVIWLSEALLTYIMLPLNGQKALRTTKKF